MAYAEVVPTELQRIGGPRRAGSPKGGPVNGGGMAQGATGGAFGQECRIWLMYKGTAPHYFPRIPSRQANMPSPYQFRVPEYDVP